MNVPYALIAPALLTAATVTYVVTGSGPHLPRDAAAEPGTTLSETATSMAADSPTPLPTHEPASTPTRDLPDALPDGVSGSLTYRTGHELVTVAFPSMDTSREPDPGVTPGDVSADGLWREQTSSCAPGTSCYFEFFSADGAQHTTVLLADYPGQPKWSLQGHTLAFATTPYGAPAARNLVVIDDPASPKPRVLPGDPRIDAPNITDFAWMADGRSLLVARGDATHAALFQTDILSGDERPIAKLSELPNFLYPSPDHSQFAFTGSSAAGWHLYVFDPARPFDVRDLGPMGSDGPGATPVPSVPDVKGPMYVAWSPDSTRLAFGGGFEPPYFMTTVDVRSGRTVRTEFPDGYPGEIKWSPDGTRLAVSSYNIPRTHHESYLVDPATGAATDVLAGCVIVWSPDSRFLAIHGEKTPGVAIADVVTLQHAQLTNVVGDTPLRWEP